MGTCIEPRELSSMLCGDVGGCDGDGVGERSKWEGLCVYIQLIHFIVQQKLTQHCKAIILQLKNNCNNLSIVGPGVPAPNLGAIGSMLKAPARPHPFPGPSRLHSLHGISEVSVFCSSSQESPWGFCFLSDRYCHWPPRSPWTWALRVGRGGG